jgi:hypothetical protein
MFHRYKSSPGFHVCQHTHTLHTHHTPHLLKKRTQRILLVLTTSFATVLVTSSLRTLGSYHLTATVLVTSSTVLDILNYFQTWVEWCSHGDPSYGPTIRACGTYSIHTERIVSRPYRRPSGRLFDSRPAIFLTAVFLPFIPHPHKRPRHDDGEQRQWCVL